MQQEIAQLHDKNVTLQRELTGLGRDKTVFQDTVNHLADENLALKERIAEMSATLDKLRSSEQEIRELVEKLATTIATGGDQELKDQIQKLEQLYRETHNKIENLAGRLDTLESDSKPPAVTGIFAYIDKEEDQSLFTTKIEEALNQEMTYAQIDEHLSKYLPAALDKIIKDHPALTKNYIRTLRQD